MALTDTFIRQVKHSGATSGDKCADRQGLYLLVKAAGKYWRLNYRHMDKRKTLALGIYSEVSLAKARQRRDKAREQLADDGAEIARHVRRFERHLTLYDWQHYIPLIGQKPGALRNGAPFATMPETLQSLQRHLLKHPAGDRVMAQVLMRR